MKKRVPAKPEPHDSHPSPKRGAVRPRRRQADKATDDHGYPSTHIVVDEAQFQALLDILGNPPDVSEELRREVADRRWK